MSKLSTLPSDRRVVTASSGNHGIASSLAASILGHNLTVYLPEGVSPAKLDKIKSFGVDVVLKGSDSGHSEVIARAAAAQDPMLTYVSPYNDPEIVAGQGTIGLEILEQVPAVDNVFISLGGGGLVSGIGSVLKAFSKNIKVIGVSAQNSAALDAAVKHGSVIDVPHLDTLADGVAGAMDEDSLTLPIAKTVIDDLIVCNEEEIASALKLLARQEHQIVEGGCSIGIGRADQKCRQVSRSNQYCPIVWRELRRAKKILPLI